MILLLLASAAVNLIIAIGGWSTLEGAKPVQLAFILIYLVLAYFVARWSRGVLPMAAAFAVLLGIFAAIAAPGLVLARQDRVRRPGPVQRRDRAAVRAARRRSSSR